jgi:predicted NAD-dependent protein-ADP-ribosyltransferase YbiA (DUF1768 family)
MDIKSGNSYPSCALSNFAPHPFEMDGVLCNSMEGFLQSLKFDKQHIQVEVCKLVGSKAKARGREKDWRKTQTLYWDGQEYKRDSEEYRKLLNRAYSLLFAQNEKFRNALMATNNAVLTHSIGKSNMKETILTEHEFCSRLMKLRENYKKRKGGGKGK